VEAFGNKAFFDSTLNLPWQI